MNPEAKRLLVGIAISMILGWLFGACFSDTVGRYEERIQCLEERLQEKPDA